MIWRPPSDCSRPSSYAHALRLFFCFLADRLCRFPVDDHRRPPTLRRLVALVTVALVTAVMAGCAGTCPTVYISSLVVVVVDNATAAPICNATVVVTNEGGTTMTQSAALTTTECAVEVFDGQNRAAPPGRYLARATWNGRTQTGSASVPAFGACGPARTTRVELRL